MKQIDKIQVLHNAILCIFDEYTREHQIHFSRKHEVRDYLLMGVTTALALRDKTKNATTADAINYIVNSYIDMLEEEISVTEISKEDFQALGDRIECIFQGLNI